MYRGLLGGRAGRQRPGADASGAQQSCFLSGDSPRLADRPRPDNSRDRGARRRCHLGLAQAVAGPLRLGNRGSPGHPPDHALEPRPGVGSPLAAVVSNDRRPPSALCAGPWLPAPRSLHQGDRAPRPRSARRRQPGSTVSGSPCLPSEGTLRLWRTLQVVSGVGFGLII